jgi:hypothetical protein
MKVLSKEVDHVSTRTVVRDLEQETGSSFAKEGYMLINFSQCRKIPFEYGGLTCQKQCILYRGEPYMLKLPFSLSGKGNQVDVGIAVREYLGSQIYASLGISVHETLLGTFNGLVVVACHHMQRTGEAFIDFSTLKTDYLRAQVTDEEQPKSKDLRDTLEIVGGHPWLVAAGGAVERFWDMFVIDLIIDNFDRNNSNWGILTDQRTFRLTPVFDNGSCFGQLQGKPAKGSPIRGARARHLLYAGHDLTAFDLMQQHGIRACDLALSRIVERLDMSAIEALIVELESERLLTPTQGAAYRATLGDNIETCLLACA